MIVLILFVSPSSTTTYKISAASCLGTTVETSVTVYVNDPPQLAVSDDETILLGESAVFDGFNR